VGAYALYKASACKEPDMSDAVACGNGSCSACEAMIAKLVPFCDCGEQKYKDEAAGLSAACRQSLADMRALRAQYRCEPPPRFTPVPVR
jgi:hypothetical protein